MTNPMTLDRLVVQLVAIDEHARRDTNNPPVGILLCTDKNYTLVDYAAAGIGSQLFISHCQVALADKPQIEAFIDAQLKEVGK